VNVFTVVGGHCFRWRQDGPPASEPWSVSSSTRGS